jgi:hypothetical protein
MENSTAPANVAIMFPVDVISPSRVEWKASYAAVA